MRKKILFINKDLILKKTLENGGQIDGRIENMFGYGFLDKSKYEESYAHLRRGGQKNFIGRLCHWLEIPFGKITRLGITLETYPVLKKEIKAADIIFCVTDSLGLGLLFWKKLSFVKAEIIVIMMGLSERLKYFRRLPFIKLFLSSLLNKASSVLTLSDSAGKILQNDFKVRSNKIKTFYCGTNTDYWRPLPEIKKENFILSIGNDGNRDFKTLISAKPENIPLKIITKKLLKAEKANVEISNKFYTNDEIRELHNQAAFEIIPSIKLESESAGLSTAEQAMSCGSAVIISRCPALQEMFVDGQDCLFYEPENPDDLKEKIRTLWEDKALREKIAANGRKKILEKYNCRKMAEQLEKIIEAEKF
jgi:glycosyltransferase involved in cell wall biosynthesis